MADHRPKPRPKPQRKKVHAPLGNKKRGHNIKRIPGPKKKVHQAPAPKQTVSGPRAQMFDPPAGWVAIFCDHPPISLVTPLGPEQPTFGSGFEGWEIEPRPRMDGMTLWRGNTPLQISFGIVFDGFATNVSQEDNIRDLIRVARGGVKDRPGIVSFRGIPGRVFDDWIIENIEWGDQIRRNSDMHRTRQFCVLTMRQYVPPEFKGIKKHALRAPKRDTKIYKAKKGDTPVRIAKKFDCKWVDIRKLNPRLKKPRQVLKTGLRVRVPVRHKPKHRK